MGTYSHDDSSSPRRGDLHLRPAYAIAGVAVAVTAVETGRLLGASVPVPYMIVYASLALAAAFSGFRAALACATLASAYTLWGWYADFGPDTLTGGPLQVGLAVLVAFAIGGALGYEHDVRRDLVQRLRTRERRLARRSERLGDHLAEVTRLLFRVQEEERGKLAHELHDDIAQSLAAIKFSLHANAGAGNVDMTDSMDRIDDLTRTIRQLTLELRPLALDDFGLAAATAALLGQLGDDTGIACRLDCADGFVDPDGETATVAYRTVQEAAANAARHSQASAITVGLSATDDALEIVIADDGCGFDVARVAAGHSGLLFMRERVRQAGGSIVVDSGPERGTTVRARLPLEGGVADAKNQAGPDR